MGILYNHREEIGARLRDAREAHNPKLSRQKLVDILNNRPDKPDAMTLERYKAWELGNNPVSSDWIVVLCKVLDCDAGYLFGEYAEKKRSISDACTITGLSENSVAVLNDYTPKVIARFPNGDPVMTVPDAPPQNVIDALLSSKTGIAVLDSMYSYLFRRFDAFAMPDGDYPSEETSKSIWLCYSGAARTKLDADEINEAEMLSIQNKLHDLRKETEKKNAGA